VWDSTTQMSKLILVLGATGAQGRHVINSLLASSEDGTPSPYAIRALTRDPQSKYALALRERGVEVVKGRSFMPASEAKCGTMMVRGLLTGDTNDLASVAAALDGAYGAWVNIDGFTVGEQREIYAGMRIFELAKQTKSLRHYVWSSLSYCLKVRVNVLFITSDHSAYMVQMGGYNQKYRCEHFDAKGRVAEWLEQQASVVSDTELSWSVVTSGPYMDMLQIVGGCQVYYRS
jgi:hypothetical protein